MKSQTLLEQFLLTNFNFRSILIVVIMLMIMVMFLIFFVGHYLFITKNISLLIINEPAGDSYLFHGLLCSIGLEATILNICIPQHHIF